MIPRTHFSSVKKCRNDADYMTPIVHEIDQFGWYSSGMLFLNDEETREDDPEFLKRVLPNAIDFTLPIVPTIGRSKPGIVVRASGNLEFDAYFFGQDKDNNYGAWQIFSYDSYQNKRSRNPDFEPGKNTLSYTQPSPEVLGLNKFSLEKTKPLNIFTTEVKPLLKNLRDYPDVCDRVYNIPLWGSDKLEVIARSREKSGDETCTVRFIPDYRDCKPQDIITLRETPDKKSWYSEDLVAVSHKEPVAV